MLKKIAKKFTPFRNALIISPIVFEQSFGTLLGDEQKGQKGQKGNNKNDKNDKPQSPIPNHQPPTSLFSILCTIVFTIPIIYNIGICGRMGADVPFVIFLCIFAVPQQTQT
ncbi:MAG: hypothetical protein IKB18_00895 [Tidjanibacter sp.]|nr:hypothetical protein [Tidjanibacter sp.]